MEVFVYNFSGQLLLKLYLREKQASSFRKQNLVFLLATSADNGVGTFPYKYMLCL